MKTDKEQRREFERKLWNLEKHNVKRKNKKKKKSPKITNLVPAVKLFDPPKSQGRMDIERELDWALELDD